MQSSFPHTDRYGVLITDDDDACRDSLRLALEPDGYETHVAECGRRAIEVARHHLIHVAILDMFMPDLNGLETIRLIREESATPVQYILVSAEISKELKLKALDEHAYSVIEKPLNLGMVRYLVREVIEKFFRG